MSNKIFAASYNEADNWITKKDDLKTVEKTGYLLLFRRKDAEPIKPQTEKFLSTMSNKDVIDVDPMPSEAFNVLVCDYVRKMMERDTTVYFVGKEMSLVYDSSPAKNLMSLCKGIAKCKNLHTRGVKVQTSTVADDQMTFFMMDKLHQNQDKDSKSNASEKDADDNDDLFQAAQSFNEIPKLSGGTEDGSKEISTQAAGEPSEPVKQRAQTASKQDKTPRKQPYKQESMKLNIRDIEKEIFGFHQEEKTPERCYSDVQNAKARLFMALEERLQSHLLLKFRNLASYEVPQEEFFQIYLLLDKTENAGEFAQSWRIQFPNFPIVITEDGYKYVKDEVGYYFQLCSILYGGDLWDQ